MGGKLLKPCISENVFILSLPLADSLVGFKMLEKELKKKKKKMLEKESFPWSFLFSFFLATQHGLWDLNSLTRDGARVPGSESSES